MFIDRIVSYTGNKTSEHKVAGRPVGSSKLNEWPEVTIDRKRFDEVPQVIFIANVAAHNVFAVIYVYF